MTSSKSDGKESTGGVEAVDRALGLVGCFTDGDATLSLHELSARTGFYKSTILRLTISLERAGYLLRMPDKSFALGPQLMRLGALYQRSFRLDRHVRPTLSDLTRETNESASFYRREGSKRICLFREDSQQQIRDHIREGDMLALDKGAAGHVLMAFSSPKLDATARAHLMHRLPMVSYGERDTETAAMAVPVFAGHHELTGALALSGPLTRFTPDRIAAMTPALIAAGRNLSTALGGRWE